MGVVMTKEEKLDKVCKDFLALSNDKQEYILGMLQALVFANTEDESEEPGQAGMCTVH
jgi:hypothetical protein